MLDLFGNEFDPKKALKKPSNSAAIMAHHKLFKIYGDGHDYCKNCQHFKERRFGKTYFKCMKFSDSRSPSSDWRANWRACGLFQQKQN